MLKMQLEVVGNNSKGLIEQLENVLQQVRARRIMVDEVIIDSEGFNELKLSGGSENGNFNLILNKTE